MKNSKHLKRSDLINLSVVLLLAGIMITGCSSNQQNSISTASLPYDTLYHLAARNAMVSSAHPSSSEIGKEIMKKGGNAVDAAVATAFAIGVVEPGMSGIGGGGGMMIWNNAEKKIRYIDFYAAKRASTYKSIGSNKEGHKLWEVGIPGNVAGLLYAQEKFGKLSRKEVMEPAVKLARDGFPMYPKLAHFIESKKNEIDQYPGKDLFRPNGETFKIGEVFKQEALARTLEKIADSGASAFYSGSVAKDIIKVLNEGGIPVTMEDFQQYKIKTDKAPLTTTYKGLKVFSPPTPQGGLEVIEDLNILDSFNLKEIGLPTQSARAFHILTGAMRAGMADRIYNVDPGWAKVPSEILTSKEYARERTKYVLQVPVPDSVEPGHFNSGEVSFHLNGMKVNEEDQKGQKWTTSLSVVDADGNAVALTQTLSLVFGGNGVWVDGFFLNNSGVDFAEPIRNPYVLSEPTGEYRSPGSTIAPTIILDKDNTVKLVIGSPGGDRIPTRIVQNIVYILDYGMDPIVAARMPRIDPLASKKGVYTEVGFDGKVYEEERKNGYDFYIDYGGGSKIYSILKKDGYWIGAADPLHQGGVSGY